MKKGWRLRSLLDCFLVTSSVGYEVGDVPRVAYAYELPRALRVWRCAIPSPLGTVRRSRKQPQITQMCVNGYSNSCCLFDGQGGYEIQQKQLPDASKARKDGRMGGPTECRCTQSLTYNNIQILTINQQEGESQSFKKLFWQQSGYISELQSMGEGDWSNSKL